MGQIDQKRMEYHVNLRELTVCRGINLLRKFFYIHLKPHLNLQPSNQRKLDPPTTIEQQNIKNLKIKFHTLLRTSESEADETNVIASPLVPNLPALPTCWKQSEISGMTM